MEPLHKKLGIDLLVVDIECYPCLRTTGIARHIALAVLTRTGHHVVALEVNQERIEEQMREQMAAILQEAGALEEAKRTFEMAVEKLDYEDSRRGRKQYDKPFSGFKKNGRPR